MDDLGLMRERAVAALGKEQWAEAAEIYAQLLQQAEQTGLETRPRGLAEDATNLGALLRKLGRSQEAIEHYQRWLNRFPDQVQLRLNAVNCVLELNHLEHAAHWIRAGLGADAHHPELLLAQARLSHRQGQIKLAREQLEAIVASSPHLLGAWLELALVCHQQGDQQSALRANGQATTLAPESAAAWGNQITLLTELGKLEQASQVLQTLVPQIRRQPDVRRATAHLWMEQQLMAEAEAELAELCKLQPGEPGHWVNRAACLRHLKHFIAAAGVLKQGLLWVPDHPQLQESLGNCLADIGKPQRGMALLQRCLPSDDRLADSSHLSLQFLGAGYGTLSAQTRQQLARAWEQRKQGEGVGPLWADRIREPLAGRRLRVGYLSADFCNHPVGRFLLPLLENHNRSLVEVWGLSCGPHQDNLTESLKRHCDHWVPLRFGSDLDLARLIADQALDVLVELGGFTGLSRIGAMVHRPAPVQLSYLGYFAPTYLQAIDGWIGDSVLFGELNTIDQEAHQLLKVEGGYMAYHEDGLPPLKRVKDHRFRFGSFNHSRKLSTEAVNLFCMVMAAVPKSQLVLKSVSFIEAAERSRIEQVFARAGLTKDRLIVLPWVKGRANHLATYAEMDIALDPLPYGGATTTCEALAMGVPVVTLAGEGMVGRLSASILSSAGLNHCIATNHEGYVAIASGLAQEGVRTATHRQVLRDSVLNSALGDGRRLAQSLEKHYASMASEALQARR